MNTNSDASVDYSDFEHQHGEFRSNVDNPTNNSSSYISTQSVDVIEDRGGLDNDEVAELVAVRAYTTLGIDDPGAVGGDFAPGKLEYRGVLGANRGARDKLDSDTGTGREESEANEGDIADFNPQVNTFTRSGVFYHWDSQLHTPFEDGAAGAGGAGSFSGNDAELVNFRSLFGRGPILDQSDDVTAATRGAAARCR
mgnify:FL=1